MKGILKKVATRLRDFLSADVLRAMEAQSSRAGPAAQLLLALHYQDMLRQGRLPAIADVGFKAFSQADEDGILLFIFALIGTRSKRCVEICAGDGLECNTANLILNHGWTGLLVDGDEGNVSRGIEFFRRSRCTYVYPPRFIHAWLTKENVNCLIREQGFTGEIDLLSIDVDGIDYWLWEAIDVIMPRVVVTEYMDILGPDRSVTVPYSDDFSTRNYPLSDGMPNFAGASLTAFVRLAKKRGYRLVAVNRYGFNAFFVREDEVADILPELSVHECFSHPKVKWGMAERYPLVKDLPWIEV